MNTRAEAPPSGSPQIEVLFQAFGNLEFDDKHPLVIFGFEEQPDPVVSARFPEIENLRLQIESNRKRDDDLTYVTNITRDGIHYPAILVYIGRKWQAKKRRRGAKRELGRFRFDQILRVQMTNLANKLRNMDLTEATIILPGRFRPKNLKKDPRGESDEEIFVQKLMESFVVANSPDTHQYAPRPHITKVTFTHFGEHAQTATHFFERAVGRGFEIGNAVSEARGLTLLPPSEKVPLLLAERLLGTKLRPRSFTSPLWRTVKNHRFGPRVKASMIIGSEGLKKAKFGQIAAVGQGSKDEPCLLKLHYQPKNKPNGMKKLTLIGKGVTLDTGGLSLKTYGSMAEMHYDMAGVATVVSVFRLAVEKNLPVEMVVLLPLVENMIGPDSIRLGDIVSAYDGSGVRITDTDSEGRLILADALAYSEAHIKPSVTVTVATLCDMQDLGPDFLKVMVNSHNLERRARVAMGRSFEKMWLCPQLELFENVSELFNDPDCDLRNDHGFHYHLGMIYVSKFLQDQDIASEWLYLDVATVFDKNADDYVAGPGFGVRFLWQFVKQYAR